MSPLLTEIDPGPRCPNVVRMIVEIPKGGANKYEYDTALGVFHLDRPLYSPMFYPGDYGFIPGTLSPDGDPLDIITLIEQPTFPGCLVEVRPIGLLRMIDTGEPDKKIIAVPERDPRFKEIHKISQVFPHIREEIVHFFEIYKQLERKKTVIKGWSGVTEACGRISECREEFLKRRSGAQPLGAVKTTAHKKTARRR